MELEIWKAVLSKEGIVASNLGRIKLPEREAPMPFGGTRLYIPKPTYGNKRKSNKKAKHEHMGTFNQKFGNLKIHQLVCEAFHGPKPFKKAVVIHIDENALNNRSDNLKWGTQKENLNMPKFIKYCESRVGDNSPVVKGRKK